MRPWKSSQPERFRYCCDTQAEKVVSAKVIRSDPMRSRRISVRRGLELGQRYLAVGSEVPL